MWFKLCFYWFSSKWPETLSNIMKFANNPLTRETQIKWSQLIQSKKHHNREVTKIKRTRLSTIYNKSTVALIILGKQKLSEIIFLLYKYLNIYTYMYVVSFTIPMPVKVTNWHRLSLQDRVKVIMPGNVVQVHTTHELVHSSVHFIVLRWKVRMKDLTC